MKRSVLFLLFFMSLPAAANKEFALQEVKSEPVACEYKNQHIFFAGQSAAYKPYEKSRDIKLLECAKVVLNGISFFTARYESLITRSEVPKRFLVQEIAMSQNEKSVVTVRSEVIEIQSLAADVPATPFGRQLKVTWGMSKSDQQPMLKLVLSGQGEPHTYFLKQDRTSKWFENSFDL